jgi:Arc/MetJ-type ribon-helix-helix transcriptional regulator
MDENERITLRLERENLELIDQFLEGNPSYKNRSQLCRDAVQSFIESVTQGGNTVQLRIPRHYLELIDALVADGYFLSREHAIVRCIEEWFDRERVKEIDEHRKEMGKATGRVMPVSTGDKDGVIPP